MLDDTMEAEEVVLRKGNGTHEVHVDGRGMGRPDLRSDRVTISGDVSVRSQPGRITVRSNSGALAVRRAGGGVEITDAGAGGMGLGL